MSINALLAALAEQLGAEGVDDVLDADFSFALLWQDLAALAGEVPPADVRRRVDARLDERVDLAPPAARWLPDPDPEPADVVELWEFFDADTAPALAARFGRG